MKNFVINFLKGVGISVGVIITILYLGFSFPIAVYAFWKSGTLGNFLTISLLPGTCWWLWCVIYPISELGKTWN